ncbi:glycosyltransferase, partial [Thermodesulfobacteriota bacterium]
MQFKPIKVVDIELGDPIKHITGLEGHGKLKALVRYHGCPVGWVSVPIYGDRCFANEIRIKILDLLSNEIVDHLLRRGLMKPIGPEGLELNEAISIPPHDEKSPWPLVTVAVCTRDRTEALAVCLESLKKLDYPNLDLLLVDNTPQTDKTEKLLKEHYRLMRYICELRPGLNWARNRAISEARGEIIAFTDDDVVVDRHWVRALARIFKENQTVMAVTGLVIPQELETKAQLLFEINGGFGRGFKRKWYHPGSDRERGKPLHIGAGIFGTGANMAYRRSLFEQIGAFDPALDVGTVTNGGGDLEMFYRVLQEGYPLVYEPGAIVRHRHRRDYAGLKTQLTNNGIGLYSYFVRNMLAYPGEAVAIIRFG